MRPALLSIALWLCLAPVMAGPVVGVDSLLEAARHTPSWSTSDSLVVEALLLASSGDSVAYLTTENRVKSMFKTFAPAWLRYTHGQWLTQHGQAAKALIDYQDALNTAPDSLHKVRHLAHFRSAVIHFKAGSLDQALSHALDAVMEAEASENYVHTLDALNFTGEVYRTKHDYETALRFYDQALDLSHQVSDTLFSVRVLNNKGIALSKLERYDLAEETLLTGLGLARATDNAYGEAILLTNLGFNEKERGQPEKAISYYEASLEIKETIGNDISIAYTLNDIGESLYFLGAFDESVRYSKQALQLAKRERALYYMKDMYKTLSKTYAAAGNYDSAYAYQLLFQTLSDSIFTDDSFREIARLEKLHELRQSTLENTLLAKEKEAADLLIAQQRWWVSLAMIIGLSAVVIGFLLWRSNNVRARFVNVLTAQNEVLDQKNAELERLLSEQEGLFNIVTHDLKGPLINAQHLLELDEEEHGTLSKSEAGPLVQTSVESALNFIEEFNILHEYEKSKQTPPLEVFNVSQLISECLTHFQPAIEQKQLSVHFNGTHEITVTSIPIYVKHIVHNLLSNAVKYSPPKGSVFITITQGDSTRISVEDQGPGISEEDQLRIFDRFFRGSAGAQKAQSNGLGLALVKLLIKKLGGSAKVKSREGEGSEFIVNLP